jgi:hypothetical protein
MTCRGQAQELAAKQAACESWLALFVPELQRVNAQTVRTSCAGFSLAEEFVPHVRNGKHS